MRRKLRWCFGICTLAVVGTALEARATLLISEPFNYSGTSLSSQNGGTGFSAGWSAVTGAISLSNDNTSLVSPNTFGVSGSRVLDSDGGEATRTLAAGSQLNMAADGVYYFSMLVRKGATGSARVAFFNSTNERWRIGIAADGKPIGGVSTDGTSPPTLSNVNDDTLLIVGRVTTLADGTSGSNDVARTKVFRSTDTVPNSDFFDTTFDVQQGTNSGVNNNTIRLTVAGDIQVDEIRVGTAYSDVVSVPEPTPLLMLATGAPAILLLRPRRRQAQAEKVTSRKR